MDSNVRRVGIFQAEYQLHSQTVNCSLCLAKAGYSVDVFLYKTLEIHELDQLKQTPNVQLYSLGKVDIDWFDKSQEARQSQHSTRALYLRVKALLACIYSRAVKSLGDVRESYLIWRGSEKGLLPASLLPETFRLAEGKRYKCLIGIEKKGLIWAGQVAKHLRVPYIYYSLELYTWDHPASRQTLHAKRTKLAEEKYHRASYATIIQDPRRGEVLLKDNRVQQDNLLYVPVSLLGGPYSERSSFLQERVHLGADKVLILSFGHIHENRFSLDLARLSQHFPKDWVLVFHGWGPHTSIQRIREADVQRRVIISLEKVPMVKSHELVGSAHIGVALYRASPTNNYLTAFSSEKLALYLQCGLPVVVFDYPGYEVIEKCRCGVLIRTLEQLPQAVRDILASYKEFSSNARACFAEYYEFSKNFRKVIDAIDGFS